MSQQVSRPLDTEILRPLIIQCLRNTPSTQLNSIYGDVLELAKKQNLVGADAQRPGYSIPSFFNEQENERMRTILWGFIVQGILVPGINQANPNLPWIKVTEY